MSDDPGGYKAWVARILSDIERTPDRQAQIAANEVRYRELKEGQERRERERAAQRKKDSLTAWREARARRLREARERALAEGLVEIAPDPGRPPSLEWFDQFIAHRVPNLRFAHCRRIGHLALGLGTEMLPKYHPNPAAYVLNYAKRVMSREISQFVTRKAIEGREHLLKIDRAMSRFADTDSQSGELPPPMESNTHEYAQAARQGRPGPLLPVGHIPEAARATKCETNHISQFPEWRDADQE
jgi:hypothetical protein